MQHQNLSENLIETYRKLVDERYRYDHLNSIMQLDNLITPERVEEVRAYFLGYIYPDAASRKAINDAFYNLENHFKNPAHLMHLIGDGATMVFKFGFQFPQALKAGLRSLDSFKSAQAFEDALLNEAIKLGYKAPVSTEAFERLIYALPRTQIEEFLDSFDGLLESLTNTSLLKKTVGIIRDLINKMETHPHIYDEKDIKGITMGVEILDAGYHLFKTMTDKEKKIMTQLIIATENFHLDRIYEKYVD
jgi:hypothetical protein